MVQEDIPIYEIPKGRHRALTGDGNIDLLPLPLYFALRSSIIAVYGRCDLSQVRYLLSSFESRDFRLLWLSTLSASAGMWTQQVALGWLVLEMTNSPLSLGMISAARMAPFLFLGMVAGTLADRFQRRNLLIAITGLSAAYSLSMAAIVLTGAVQFWHLFLLTLVFGCARALESPARQALIYDIVGSADALKGISLNAVAMRLMGVIGGALGGVMITLFGPGGSFLLMACTYILSGLILMGMRGVRSERTIEAAPFWSSLRTGVGLLKDNQVVLALVIMSVMAEMFAFSHNTLLPVFARDVLAVGPIGLGLLTSALGLGGIIALLTLTALTRYGNGVQLLLWILGLYGIFLLLFATSGSYFLSLGIIIGVGAAAAAFDTLQQTVLQSSVPDSERGRVMGYWVVSLGLGPLGHLELGALAGVLGAPIALGVNASVIIVTYLIMTIFVSKSLLKREEGGYERG